MDEFINRLQRLPKEQLVCQGGYFDSPLAVLSADGLPYTPTLAVWTTATDEGVLAFGARLTVGDDPCVAIVAVLDAFVTNCMGNRACPNRLQVGDLELAEYLCDRLQGTGIAVELVDQLPRIEAVITELAAQLQLEDEPLDLLDAEGMNVARVRCFAAAAADFYRSAPWRHLSELDVIEIESPVAPSGMAYLIVAGAAGAMFGLHFLSSRADYDHAFTARNQPARNAGPLSDCAQIEFGARESLPVGDAELWTMHELPVAGHHAYPSILKRPVDRGEVARPTTAELTFMEGVLQALASTSEKEIDSGRWCKTVSTFDGQLNITLTIPDLHEPPTVEEWIRRGLTPDPRACVYMPHYFVQYDSTPANSRVETVRAINQLKAARALGDPLTRPHSPTEQAQDLCFASFATHGRRRTQLANRALELDPSCSNAYLILAERATLIENKLDLYLRALEVAERNLGAAYFVENAGHFWELWTTRSYMGARVGIAESLATAGRADEAIVHYAELLRLNPKDDQSVRYFLLPLLMTARRDIETAQLVKQFDDKSASWAYAKALLAFRLAGALASTDRLLREAIGINSQVVALLCSDVRYPRPTRYARGSFEEACFVAEQLRPAYEASEGALDWLAATQHRREQEPDKQQREKRRKDRARQKKGKRR